MGIAWGHFALLPPETPPVEHGATGLIGLLHPYSRGRMTLDRDGLPLFDPAYLTDERDVEALVHAVALARVVAGQEALRPWELTELAPGPEVDGDGVEAFVRAAAGSYFHPVGTCAMGSVVDTRLRVRGLSNLRVADAAVIPVIPAAATSLPAQLIG